MSKLLVLVMMITIGAAQAPVPATLITRDEAAKVLRESIANGTVDQPIEASQVLGHLISARAVRRSRSRSGTRQTECVRRTESTSGC